MATFIISGRDSKHNKRGLEPDYPLICDVSRYTTKLSPLELRKTLEDSWRRPQFAFRAEQNIRTATVAEKKRFQLINSEKSVMSEKWARVEGISNRE